MKDGKAKRSQPKAKPAPKKKKPAAKTVVDAGALDNETHRIERRVASLRDKLRIALDDPEKRQQMVEAIRMMMNKEQ